MILSRRTGRMKMKWKTKKTWKRTMRSKEEDEDDYESEEPGVVKEVVLAQEFDVKLEREVSRRTYSLPS